MTGPRLHSGQTPAPAASNQIGSLFIAALRDFYGITASAVAERECQLHGEPRRVLPARTVQRAAACARSAHTLLLAQAQLMQFEYSAVLQGWRFRRLTQSLGLDADQISPERRQAIDAGMADYFKGPPPSDTDTASEWLRRLLVTGLH